MHFDPAEFERALTPRRVVALPETTSTNDVALQLAREGAPHGTTVVADVQTAGRGRKGRSWWAEPGSALLTSWIVRPKLPVERWTVLPLFAGLAVAEALEQLCGLHASLKWPNDVMIGERKLGGILSEAHPGTFVVVGVGLNLAQRSFPTDLIATATSVESGGVPAPDRATLLSALLTSFDHMLGDPSAALERYRAHCSTLGRQVRISLANGDQIEGIGKEVDDRGALVVDTPTGPRAVASGEVVHVR